MSTPALQNRFILKKVKAYSVHTFILVFFLSMKVVNWSMYSWMEPYIQNWSIGKLYESGTQPPKLEISWKWRIMNSSIQRVKAEANLHSQLVISPWYYNLNKNESGWMAAAVVEVDQICQKKPRGKKKEKRVL